MFGSFAEPRCDEWDSEPRNNGELKDGNEKTCEENSMIEVLAQGPSLNIGCRIHFSNIRFYTGIFFLQIQRSLRKLLQRTVTIAIIVAQSVASDCEDVASGWVGGNHFPDVGWNSANMSLSSNRKVKYFSCREERRKEEEL